MAYSSDVLIVGAGVGGLSLGLRLARQGYRVRILQQREPALPTHRPEMVQPAALQALAELDLLDQLKVRTAARVDQFNFYRIGGGPLCHVDYRILNHPHPYALIVLPPQTKRLFLDALREHPTVHIHWDTSLTAVIRRGKQVIGARAMEGQREQDFYASVTVGADGRASGFRKALHITSWIKQYRNAFLGLLVHRPEGLGGHRYRQVRYHLGQGEVLGCFPYSPTRLCLLYMVPARGLSTVTVEMLAAIRKRVTSIEPGLEDSLMDRTDETRVSRLYPVRVRTASWVSSGAALLGDAAHACHPHVAQGSFQAMEDGRVLAKVLERCFGRGDFSARALAPYEQERRPVVQRLQRVADEYTWLWEAKSPLFAWLRDRIFRTVGSRPDLLQKIAATEAGIDIRPLGVMERLQAMGVYA